MLCVLSNQTPLLYHYLLVAALKFHDSKGRYPGNFFDEDSEMDDSAMVSCITWTASNLMSTWICS